MAFRKTQSVEKVEVIPSKEREVIIKTISKVGATSASQLTDEQRIKAKLLDTQS